MFVWFARSTVVLYMASYLVLGRAKSAAASGRFRGWGMEWGLLKWIVKHDVSVLLSPW